MEAYLLYRARTHRLNWLAFSSPSKSEDLSDQEKEALEDMENKD